MPEPGFTLTISPLTVTALETDLEARAPGEQGLAAQGFLAAQGLTAQGFLAMQGFFAAQGFTAQGFLAAHGFFAAQGLA